MSKIIIVEKYIQDRNKHTLYLTVDGKAKTSMLELNTEKQLPQFFIELWCAQHILTPGGYLWERPKPQKNTEWIEYNAIVPSVQVEGNHIIIFKFPVSSHIKIFMEKAAKLSGLAIAIKAPDKEVIISENFNLFDRWQLGYSGGKDSTLSAYLLNEIIQDEIKATGCIKNENPDWIPTFIKRETFNMLPYQTTVMTVVGTMYALWNERQNLGLGLTLSDNLPVSKLMIDGVPYANSYISGCEAYHILYEEYMKNVVGDFHVTSITASNATNINVKILKERYSECLPHIMFTPTRDCAFHTTLLFYGLSLPEVLQPTKQCLKTFEEIRTLYSKVIYAIEVEHMLNKLRGHPLLDGNKLQYSNNFYPWVETVQAGLAQPRYLKDEIYKIHSNHVEIDYTDRWGEINNLFIKWQKQQDYVLWK